MSGVFSLVVIDGDLTDFLNVETPYIRYNALDWQEVTALCASAFKQGFQCAIVKQGDGGEGEGGEYCAT